jgi:membrane fusion protein (multidrug efflux system)
MRALVVSLLVLSCAKPREVDHYNAVIEAPTSACAAPIDGRITTFHVREGDRVQRGQLLVEIESSMLEAAVEKAEVALEGARLAARNIEATSAQQDPSRRLAMRDEALAKIRSAELEVDIAKAQLDLTRIHSPFDGTVVLRKLEIGEWAERGAAVITVQDILRPSVRLDVDEKLIASIDIGRDAEIRVPALGNRSFRGRVMQLGTRAEPREHVRSFMVRVSFLDPPNELRPGMSADVKLEGGPRENALHQAMR